MASYYKYSASMNDRTYFTSVVTTTAGNIKRYFSNVESEVYFGDKEMEDIYQFQFSIDEKVLPIYGYNCYYASELVSGQRIIQGQFILNYTNEQEIKTTLGEIDSSVYESILADSYHPSGGSISDPIYNKLFDIMIGYGYYNVKDKQTYNATCQTIVGCKISGMQKVIDSTGQPIMEVYNFVAMDFIEENIVESEQAGEVIGDKDKEGLAPGETPLAYVCSDLYNSVEIATHNKLIEQYPDCKHLLHNLLYVSGCISLQIEEVHGYSVTLKKGTIEIIDRLSDNVIIPVFNFSSVSGGIARVDLEKKYCDLFDKTIKEDITVVSCCLKYDVTVNDGTKSKDYSIKYENGILYL